MRSSQYIYEFSFHLKVIITHILSSRFSLVQIFLEKTPTPPCLLNKLHYGFNLQGAHCSMTVIAFSITWRVRQIVCVQEHGGKG